MTKHVFVHLLLLGLCGLCIGYEYNYDYDGSAAYEVPNDYYSNNGQNDVDYYGRNNRNVRNSWSYMYNEGSLDAGEPTYSSRKNFWKSGDEYSDRPPSYRQLRKPVKRRYIPVVLKKKEKKKSKVYSVTKAQYIPGGLRAFGKVSDLSSCQKMCEITPNCFAGDFNTETNRCYMHSNSTACGLPRSHPAIIHFKKVPCSPPFTSRGRVTLGAHAYNGVQLKEIDNLKDCVKKCANMGGGIASTFNTIPTTPQLCFAIDFDFSNHRCFVHVHTTSTDAPLPILLLFPPPFPLPKGYQAYCPKTGTVGTPGTLAPNMNFVNIVMCPRT